MSDAVVVAIIAAAASIASVVVPLIRDRKHGWTNISKDLEELKNVAHTNGDNINDIKAEVDTLKGELTHHKEEFANHTLADAEMRAQQLRGVIIEFSKRIDRWKAGATDYEAEMSDSEYWSTYIKYIDVYEDLCSKYNIKNGVCQNAIKKIRKAYEEVSFA